MVPALVMPPASGVSVKRRRLLMKSLSDRRKVEATNPATSTCAPAPNTMPLGLTKNTRPLDCRLPKMTDGSTPVTRFSTWLLALCCTKRVSSPRLMLNCCQLMMAPGVLVTVKVLPTCENDACPLTTTGAWGLAIRLVVAVAVSSASNGLGLKRFGLRMMMFSLPS